VTTALLTVGIEEVFEQSSDETNGVKNFVHNADHLLFMENGVRGSLHVVRADLSFTHKRSLGSASQRAGSRTGNIGAGRVNLYEENEIGVNTGLEDGRSTSTADATGGGLHLTRNRVLDLKSSREVIKDGGNEIVLNVILESAGGTAKTTIVTIGSELAVTSKSSSRVVITFRVPFFFDIEKNGRFLLKLTMGTFPMVMRKSLQLGGKKSYDK